MQAFHYDVVILPFRKQADEEGKPRPDLEAPHPARPEKPLGPEICRSADLQAWCRVHLCKQCVLLHRCLRRPLLPHYFSSLPWRLE